MFQDQEFTVGFDVDDPIQFTVDSYTSTMNHLKFNYEGKCFKGVFITEVTKIKHLSACTIIDTNVSAGGHFNVTFVAKVLHYEQWDIIIGAKVLKTDTLFNVVEKLRDRGCASIVANVGSQSILQVDQLVPIRIDLPAIHPPMSTHVTASAKILTCDKKSPVITIKGKRTITSKILADVTPYYNMIKKELELRSGLDRDRLFFFEELLFSFSKGIEKKEVTVDCSGTPYIGFTPVQKDAENINLFELTEMPSKSYRSMWLCRSSPFISDKPDDKSTTDISMSLIDCLIYYSRNIYNYLVATRELVETYNTPELIKGHENIWRHMRKSQISS